MSMNQEHDFLKTLKVPPDVSVAEYAKNKGIEMEAVSFIGIPCRHSGATSADMVIEQLKQTSPDLVLFEDATGFEGKDLLEVRFNDSDTKEDTGDVFNKKLFSFLAEKGIAVKPFNGYFDTMEKSTIFHNELVNSFDFSHYVKESSSIKDDEEAWKYLETNFGVHVRRIVRLQHEREDGMLANIAPTILSLGDVGNLKKVAIVVGQNHSKRIFEKLLERGESVEVLKNDFVNPEHGEDFSSLSTPAFFLWSVVAPFGGELALRGRSLYEFEITLGTHIVSLEKVKDVYLKLRRGNLSVNDLTVNVSSAL